MTGEQEPRCTIDEVFVFMERSSNLALAERVLGADFERAPPEVQARFKTVQEELRAERADIRSALNRFTRA